MDEYQKALVNGLIQDRMVYLKDKINECKELGRSSNDPSDKEFLDTTIKVWQAELNELKKIKL